MRKQRKSLGRNYRKRIMRRMKRKESRRRMMKGNCKIQAQEGKRGDIVFSDINI